MAGQRPRPSAASPPKSRVRGPYARTAARRAEIIDAAVEVFSRSGYVSAPIREIATRLGVSHATLIFHFATKDELLGAVLERSEESYKPVLDRASKTPIEFLAYVLEEFRERPSTSAESEMFLRLAVEARDPSHQAHPYMVRRYRRLLQVFTGVFEALGEQGLLKRSADVSQLARFTIALMDGLQISARYHGASVGIAPVVIAPDLETHFSAALNAEGRRRLASQPTSPAAVRGGETT